MHLSNYSEIPDIANILVAEFKLIAGLRVYLFLWLLYV